MDRMSPELWDTASLREMLHALAEVPGRVSDRKLDLFNGWCCHALRPYLTDPRSRAAARYAEAHIDQGGPGTLERAARYAEAHIDQGCPDTLERAAVLLAAKEAVEELIQWAHSAPTSAELRR